jgi:hypothetical protein
MHHAEPQCFSLQYDNQVYGPYDGVVLAAPQELSGIQIDLGDGGSKGASLAAGPRKFQRTVTTYVIGTDGTGVCWILSTR